MDIHDISTTRKSSSTRGHYPLYHADGFGFAPFFGIGGRPRRGRGRLKRRRRCVLPILIGATTTWLVVCVFVLLQQQQQQQQQHDNVHPQAAAASHRDDAVNATTTITAAAAVLLSTSNTTVGAVQRHPGRSASWIATTTTTTAKTRTSQTITGNTATTTSIQQYPNHEEEIAGRLVGISSSNSSSNNNNNKNNNNQNSNSNQNIILPTRIRKHNIQQPPSNDQQPVIPRTKDPFPAAAAASAAAATVVPVPVPVQSDDKIYKDKRLSPVVVARYKFIFFDVPKVASSAWMILLQRMSGIDRTKLQYPLRVHHPKHSQLTYLWHYNATYAAQILNDPTWTRATFVRDPHERILSVYLDKGIGTKFQWIKNSCCKRSMKCLSGGKHNQTFAKFVDLATGNPGDPKQPICRNDHWYPQNERIDTQFWPLINFVGRFDHLQDDARALLQRIGAWEEHGRTGWGYNHSRAVFERDNREGRGHQRDTSKQMHMYYNMSTAEGRTLYRRVSEYYRDDYRHTVLGKVLQQPPPPFMVQPNSSSSL